jgi:DNA mismatch repair protein MutS
VLSYAEFTQGGDLDYVTDVVRYDPREFMRLDRTALRSLELFDSRTGGEGHTLFDAVDETSSALGRRTLRGWIRRPLVDRAAIEARHDAVEELAARSLVRPELRELLQDVYDLERLVSRVSQGRANARDLRSLLATLDIVPEVRDALADAEADRLRELRDQLDELGDVRSLLRESIREEPPVEVTEGEVIREGFDPDLDSLRRTEREGREWVADLEAREQERTGIDSLAVGYNEVHGYYIEVTDPNLDRVPDDYTRRQTLKNSERFYTPELKEREDEILGAAERADSLEYELFVEVREAVAAEAERVQTTAAALSALDALATLAEVAVEHGYSRPTMGADGIEVEAGRHPVVERTRDPFVPNDTDLTDERFAVVTGPNMSGKSTYMRQVALIAVLAQAGSFVPADAACLPVFDRVFTRVGASDDLAGGQSTFMREMAELTEILHHATEDSLVLLDEVGRGTSTTDGLSIAWATTEYVHDEVGAFTLFATHYHELTDAAAELPGVQNLHFVADREGGDVTFLHTVREGASAASYGVDVADLAGGPDPVVERARSLMECGGPTAADDQRRAGAEADGGTPDPATDSGQEGVPADVVERLREIEVAETTPLEALNELQELTRHVDN